MAVVAEFVGWIARKLLTGLLLAVVALTISMGFIWVREQRGIEQERQMRLQELRVEQLKIESDMASAGTQLETLRAAFDVQRDRAAHLERLIAIHKSQQSWWNFMFGDPEQNRISREKLERATTDQRNTQLMLEELSSKIEATLGLQVDLADRRKAVIDDLAREDSATGFYQFFRSAWQRSKWLILSILALYYFGPTLIKVLAYYGAGRWIGSGRPIIVNKEPRLLPEVRSEGTSLEIGLWPGDVAWLRERIVRSSDTGLEAGKRRFLSWLFPLSSISSGLFGMVELSNRRAGDPVAVTLADKVQPENELALVRVPEGGSIVLRPSTVAGVIKPRAEVLVVKRRWRLLHWQAWISGQFRFFEFQGPVRLVIAGTTGLKTEWLSPTDGASVVSRRAEQEATIGFTPNMRMRPVRAESFWAYYRNKKPLFDDQFLGEGVFICREWSRGRTFNARLWDAVLKAFGV